MTQQIITRFAPSPTGKLHLGGARTALFCYLFAKKHQGKFLLRIEDTDKERSRDEHVASILESLKWLGLQWDEEPVRQSQRLDEYTAIANQLIEQGNAYRCTCTPAELEAMRQEQAARGESNPKYDGRHREANLGAEHKDYVIRFKNPLAGEVAFIDEVQGEVRVGNQELDDMVLVRADGSPTYNFCAVVDDIAMNITQVIRGDDHLRNSLRQCNLYAALGAEPPKFAHLPMIHNQQGARLSKRDGADDLLNYRARGLLPGALCSYLARLGWSSGDQELFSRDELIELFDLSAVQKSPAGYDEDKLLWVNHKFIAAAAAEDLLAQLESAVNSAKHAAGNDSRHDEQAVAVTAANTDGAIERHQDKSDTSAQLDLIKFPKIAEAIELHKDRCSTLLQLAAELAIYHTPPGPADYDKEGVAKFVNPPALQALAELQDKLASSAQWDAESIKATIKGTLAEHNLKFPQLAMPLRLAITGTANSPSIDKVTAILSQDEALKRISTFIAQHQEVLTSP